MSDSRLPGADLDPALYVVSTPIGAARDITLRALDVLRDADVIAAEDTRMTRKLMELHGVPLGDRRLLPYHDHNGAAQRPKLLRHLAEGRTVAHVSDAGTPMVADPGYQLVRAALAAGHAVRAVPGPSSLLAALVVSGLPTDRFLFAGFLPAAEAARKKTLAELAAVPATLVFFETAKRLLLSLRTAVSELGGERQAAICRELTKKFEETRRGTLDNLLAQCAEDPPRGEIVLLVDRGRQVPGPDMRDARLKEAMKDMSVKDAARAVADELGLPRREVYQAALDLTGRT